MYLPVIVQLHSQHGLITTGQLVAAGLDHYDIDRLGSNGRLLRLRRGVYVDPDAWADLDPFRQQPLLRIRAASMSLTSTAYVFSHDSSAIALEMGAPDPRTALVHVTRRKVHGDAVRAGVKHHLAPYLPDDVVEVDGLRMLGPARTALDMVREHGRAHGLAACDAAMRQGVTPAQLREVLARMKDWPHSRCMRWCIEHADPLAETYLESLLRDFVLELGIGRPDLQFGLTDGRTTAFADVAVHRHLFEADGGLKYEPDNPAAMAPTGVLLKEKHRQDFLAGFKLGMSRLTYVDMFSGRRGALARAAREYADTCARFGKNTDDLAPYRVSRRP
ncbi:type IV toxin-antitoxin system AbiEi family antitoxin domain-containing protein [Nocardioides baculatus]|uniref:Type IV toxin-antitoxin system AbiEi family antitoxin domain-containing protein n=1 Tax=Nocardioides baculatus TaxID=2801337 RepID=A0ABS1L885_9ACTN|nr:type IV toxin-antitoxin system AbiEi family antitoxin domain-containing protein [Nocardioides baculatus]MBL0747628.1 type IV toxin-antitoxin system AbiEi family antitoxin domain-containing protein [Nocardioides baculatus]